jgi:hypothetical protein
MKLGTAATSKKPQRESQEWEEVKNTVEENIEWHIVFQQSYRDGSLNSYPPQVVPVIGIASSTVPFLHG